MTTEFERQFRQSWKIFDAIVQEFDAQSWAHTGVGYMVPARVAFHILTGVEYYIQRKSDWSTRFAQKGGSTDAAALPSQQEAHQFKEELEPELERWLDEIEIDAANAQFPWAGKTQAGVLAFVVRHTMFHLGELNALLYQSRNGEVEDKWISRTL